ncbi:PEP-CTERM sorting domain-containing protein [bacterium]|nr:PEP-CTERM sorting domain-containing protein [bacterium]
MKKALVCIFMLLLLFCFARSGSAIIINGDFETGDLSGWLTSGPGNIFVGAYMGNHFAQMETGYDDNTGAYVTSLYQDFVIPASPEPIKFDFHFWTSGPDYQYAMFIDALTASLCTTGGDLIDFLIIDDMGMIIDPLATVTASSIFSGGYHLSLDVSGFAGNYATLYFDLWDEDDLANSVAKIDNVTANPVPEPGTILLFIIGIIGLAGFRISCSKFYRKF